MSAISLYMLILVQTRKNNRFRFHFKFHPRPIIYVCLLCTSCGFRVFWQFWRLFDLYTDHSIQYRYITHRVLRFSSFISRLGRGTICLFSHNAKVLLCSLSSTITPLSGANNPPWGHELVVMVTISAVFYSWGLFTQNKISGEVVNRGAPKMGPWDLKKKWLFHFE